MGSQVKVVDRNYLIKQFQNYDTNVVTPQIQNLEDKKVDKVAGYGLSKNDFTDAFKQKLESLQNYNDGALTERVSNVELVINTLQGDAATPGSIAKMTADAVASIVDSAPQDFDTLKEISNWITGHADSAAAMNSQITENTEKISQIESQLGGLDLSVENVDIDFGDLYGDGNVDIVLTANENNTVAVGDTLTINSNIPGVAFSVDDESKATIDSNGVLTPIENGVVTVTATKYAHTTGTIEITILPAQEPGPEIPPFEPGDQELPVTPTIQIVGEANVNVGDTLTLTSNAPNTVWSSENDEIATVDQNGVVTGVSAGEVTIIASAEGYNNGTKGITVSVVPRTEEAGSGEDVGTGGGADLDTNGDDSDSDV